jgi:hypothetical protein
VSNDHPALRMWRRELQRGLRSPKNRDPLARAAAWEAAALEAEQDGSSVLAAECRRQARDIIHAAARGNAA